MEDIENDKNYSSKQEKRSNSESLENLLLKKDCY